MAKTKVELYGIVRKIIVSIQDVEDITEQELEAVFNSAKNYVITELGINNLPTEEPKKDKGEQTDNPSVAPREDVSLDK